jgi:hypothetical protein
VNRPIASTILVSPSPRSHATASPFSTLGRNEKTCRITLGSISDVPCGCHLNSITMLCFGSLVNDFSNFAAIPPNYIFPIKAYSIAPTITA